MSVIGPRPGLWNQDILTAERDKYNANDVKPGLTGWAQINGRDELEIPEKAKLIPLYDTDLYYNLIKRIAREAVNNEEIEKNELYDYFVRLLTEIEDKLRENDEYYEENEKFSDIFDKCPVIKKIKGAASDKKEIYIEFIWEIINDNYVDKNGKKVKLQKENN